MSFIRMILLWFIVASVLFLMLSVYLRSLTRERLEKEWAEDHPDGGDETAREAYIDAGMLAYRTGLWPKLLWLIYLVPAVFVLVTHLATSYF